MQRCVAALYRNQEGVSQAAQPRRFNRLPCYCPATPQGEYVGAAFRLRQACV